MCKEKEYKRKTMHKVVLMIFFKNNWFQIMPRKHVSVDFVCKMTVTDFSLVICLYGQHI